MLSCVSVSQGKCFVVGAFCCFTVVELSTSLTLKVLFFFENSLRNGVGGSLDSYCSLKPLWSGMGEVVPARTSTNPASPIPSHCAVIILFRSVPVHQLSWLAL